MTTPRYAVYHVDRPVFAFYEGNDPTTVRDIAGRSTEAWFVWDRIERRTIARGGPTCPDRFPPVPTGSRTHSEPVIDDWFPPVPTGSRTRPVVVDLTQPVSRC
jgi:hypothetical protein